MDLPHINVLTKIDNLSNYGPLPFNLDYYTEVQDLSYIMPHLEQEAPGMIDGKFEALNKAIVELIEDFSLVAYQTLAVEDKRSMMDLLKVIDRASGYAFGSAEGANDTVWQVAMREGMSTMEIQDVQERWIDMKDEYDEIDRKTWEEEAKARDVERAKEADQNNIGASTIPGLKAETPQESGIKIVRKNGAKH